jgi:choline dehydrogenase-like flavoprotein
MIVSSSFTSGQSFDLCVVGSGPAGMIVALEFARNNPGKQVLLAEFGADTGTGNNSLDDSIRNTNPANHTDPYECTNKGLGGTSATWGGRCVMYDDIDFLDRPQLNGGCTWRSATLKALKPFLQKSAEYFECGSATFSLRDMPEKRDHRIAEGFIEGDVLDSPVERWSMPTRFRERYHEELKDSENITVWCGVEARHLECSEGDETIKTLEFREVATGHPLTVKAANFVLAAGAQESTRLLLRNPDLFQGIGGPPESLGRYYQGHVSGKIASIRFQGDPKKTDYAVFQDPDGSYFRRRFQFSTEALLREKLLNTAIWLDNPLYHDPSHRSGAMSMIYLAMITPFLGKRLAPPAIAASVTKGKVNGLSRHLLNVLRGLPGSLVTPASLFFRRYCLKRKLPGIYLFSEDNCYALHFHAEQIPNAENRMVLGDDGETLEIHYQLTDTDVDSVIRAHGLLDIWLKKCGCGKLDYWFSREELPKAIRTMSRDGLHQNGTTRIADSPGEGVLDSDMKVWGTNNLYVCSSSAFPTSGQANPTFSLGAFAVRLAHHLSQSHA